MSEKFQWSQIAFFYSFTPERAQCEALSLKTPVIKISSTLKRDRDFSTEKGIAMLNSAHMKTVCDLPLNFDLTLLPRLYFLFPRANPQAQTRDYLYSLVFFLFLLVVFQHLLDGELGKKSTQGALGVIADQKKSENITLMLTASLQRKNSALVL